MSGPDLSRRGFLQLGASGLVASWFLKSPAAAWAAESAAVTTRNTARNVIFVFLPGAPSQTDTWDLKEGAWTPSDFAPAGFGGGLRFPAGVMPNMANHLGDVAIVRSMKASALVHGLGQTWLQIARNPTGATASEAPNMGAVAALELEKQRGPNDVLPAFLSLNTQADLSGAGYFGSTYAPFVVVQPTATGLPELVHPNGTARFATRWSDLQALEAAYRAGQPIKTRADDAAAFYTQAKVLVDTPAVNDLFKVGASDSVRYGSSVFGDACLVARQVLGGNRGARFVMVSLGGWDMHNNIYSKSAATSLYTQLRQLDPALASLIVDLKASPGAAPGKTLFDETLVVVAGEFGRTVGNLNGSGRDHFAVYSAVFAGGGVRGGQVIGATDATGATITDSGVTGRTELRAEDLACTVYSALGIDWTTMRYDDPLGRGFEYVPNAAAGVYAPIDRLFG